MFFTSAASLKLKYSSVFFSTIIIIIIIIIQ